MREKPALGPPSALAGFFADAAAEEEEEEEAGGVGDVAAPGVDLAADAAEAEAGGGADAVVEPRPVSLRNIVFWGWVARMGGRGG